MIHLKILVGLLFFSTAQTLYSVQTKPNVVIFFVDDLGWSDLQHNVDYFPQGSLYYETPNLDSLASESVVFHQAYAQPVCSTSRATLMSGQYSNRFHLNGAIVGGSVAQPAYEQQTTSPLLFGDEDRNEMPQHLTTLAERLRDQHGYATWHVGKWHIGSANANQPNSPAQRGFDRQFFTLGAGMGQGYFGPISGPQSVVYPDGSSAVEDKYVHTQEILDKICKDLIDDHVLGNAGTPFFLNFWLPVVHTPVEDHIANIDYFENKLPSPDARHQNPVYAAMVKRYDDSLGNLIQALKDAGEYNDTLFIFWSDNGGVDFEVDSSEHDPNSSSDIDITPTLLPQYSKGSGVTATSNAPLREGKGDSYEGGVRVPALITYPHGNLNTARLVETPVHLIDLFPTILDFAGEGSNVASILDHNNNTQPLDGVSIRSLLEGTSIIERDLFHYRQKNNNLSVASIRRGNWKLYRWFTAGHDGFGQVELYNLVDDISETTNLAGIYIDTAAQMLETLDAWVQTTSELPPIPNPNYDGVTLDDPEYDYLGWILNRYPLVTSAEIPINVDIESDGFSNIQEHILDSNPIQKNLGTEHVVVNAQASNHDIYFRTPVDIISTAYSLESSDALQNFSPVLEAPQEIGAGQFGRAVFDNSFVYKTQVPVTTETRLFYRLSGEIDTSGRQDGSETGFFIYSIIGDGNTPEIVDPSAINASLPDSSALETPIGGHISTTDLVSQLTGTTFTLSLDFAWHDVGGNDINESVLYNFGTSSSSSQSNNTPLSWGISLDGTGASTTGTFYIGVGDGATWNNLYVEDLGIVGDDASQFYAFSIRIDDASDTIINATFNGIDITASLVSRTIPNFGSSRELTIAATGSGMRSLTDNLLISLTSGDTIISDNFNVNPTNNINANLQNEPVLDYNRLLFKDNFDIEDNSDINADLPIRQFGPFSPASYLSAQSPAIVDNTLEVPLLTEVNTIDFGMGPDSIVGNHYRFEWTATWNDLNNNDNIERFWWTLSGSNTAFKNAGASIQVGLDIDNAEFYIGLGDGTTFTTVATIPLPGVIQGEDAPEQYFIRIIVDETGAQPTLSVEFQGVEVNLSQTAIQWQNGNDRTFYLSASGSGIRGYVETLTVHEL